MAVPRFLLPAPDLPIIASSTHDARYRQMRVRMLAALTVVYGFFYTSRSVLDIAKKPLIDANIYDADQLGTIGSCLLVAYAFGKLLNGFLADHVRVSRFLALGLGASAMVNILMGFNTIYVVACALWAANGLFQGVGAATSVKSLTQWFGRKEFGRAYGTWSTAQSLGETATLLATAAIVTHMGWRAGFLGPGVSCLIVATAALFVLRDRPQAYGLPNVSAWKGEIVDDTAVSTAEAQREVLWNPIVWLSALASALLYVARYGIKSWGVLYLQECCRYSLPSASASIALNAAAGFLGCTTYGFISDVVFKGRRMPATVCFGLVELVALLTIFYGPRNPFAVAAAMLVYGFALSGALTALGGLLAVDVCPKNAAGMAMGLVGFISYVGAALQEKLSGMMLEAHTIVLAGGGKRIDDWSGPIRMWLGASVASLVVVAIMGRVEVRLRTPHQRAADP